MSTTQDLRSRLTAAILAYDAEGASALARALVQSASDPASVLQEALAAAAAELGAGYEDGSVFVPHLVLAGRAMEAAADALRQAVSTAALPAAALPSPKVVVIGVVEGDIHSLGKNIVATMLRANGFVVHDLGFSVTARRFVERALETNADIIAASSLLTTTLPHQRELIDELTTRGLRQRFKVLVGGGSCTSAWAEEIGADGYGQDVTEAVAVAKRLAGLA